MDPGKEKECLLLTPDQMAFSGDEYYQFDPSGLDGTYNLTYQIGREVCVFSSSQSMRVTCQPLQVNVSDVTVCPASIVDEIQILTSFNDYDLEVTTEGMNALGGTDLVNEPVENGRAVIPSFNSIAVRDQTFPITVITSQTNVNGCADTIMFEITVQDLEAPQFVNCPRPNIVQDAETGLCDAFVTFSLPFVEDNCDPDPLLEKVDTTGLTSGDRFPVGLTTLIWVATDTVGNFDTCEIKVLVEDLQKPELICPTDSITLFNDPGICGATVNNVTPVIEDNCTDNSALIYRIFDQMGDL